MVLKCPQISVQIQFRVVLGSLGKGDYLGEWFALIDSWTHGSTATNVPEPQAKDEDVRRSRRCYRPRVVDARYDDTHAFPSSLPLSLPDSPKTQFPNLGNISQGWECCQVYHLGIKDGEKPPAPLQLDEASEVAWSPHGKQPTLEGAGGRPGRGLGQNGQLFSSSHSLLSHSYRSTRFEIPRRVL